MSEKIQTRNGTASSWTSANPTLWAGEIGYETDTKWLKIGDGVTPWNSLTYYGDRTGIAGGGNMLPNGDFSSMGTALPTDWSRWYSHADFASDTCGANSNPVWSLMGNMDPCNRQYLNTLWLQQTGSIGSPADFDEIYSPRVPVIAGRSYCASVYTGAHRCKVDITIEWYNEAGTGINGVLNGASENNAEKAGGPTLAGYKRVYTFGVAPTGATRALVSLVKHDTIAGNADSWLFAARAMFEEISPFTIVPSNWAPPSYPLGSLITAPVGSISMYGGASAPPGYLLCDGRSILRTDYPGLYAAIGTAYGSADGTHFSVPNFCGLSPTGPGAQTINTRVKVGPALGEVREDQGQGHEHAFWTFGGGGSTPAVGSYSSSTRNAEITSSSGNVGNPISDLRDNGSPRVGTYTHGPEIGVNFIIKT